MAETPFTNSDKIEQQNRKFSYCFWG